MQRAQRRGRQLEKRVSHDILVPESALAASTIMKVAADEARLEYAVYGGIGPQEHHAVIDVVTSLAPI